MTSLMNHLPIMLAQSEEPMPTMVDRGKIPEISKYFNEGVRHELPWELLLVGLGMTLVLITIVSIHRWWKRRQDDPTAVVLFSAIARKAGLGWSDRFMLWRVARANDLPSPIALLLARGALRHYVKVYNQNRSSRAKHSLNRRIMRIEAELFG